ncbi:MAG: N-acyl-D-amino-acid deacylase family protein [Gemmatimonadaceae bacterium]
MRITPLLAAVLAIAAGCRPLYRAPANPTYDVILRNGRVVDGTGNPWYYGDVAIIGDRIAHVGPARSLSDARAHRVIDATGLVVAPGFIDMLGHSEYAILRNPGAISKITQGITSEITGEVSSAWPNTVPGERRPDSGVDSWDSLEGYFSFLEEAGTAINLGTYVAAASVRRAVMGDASRSPTPDELAQMGELVERAMRDGAMGFSTGLIYPPTTFFSTEELTILARRAAANGGGYASHIRSEGENLLDAIREAIHIGTAADTWVEIRHLKASGPANWPKMAQAIALIDSARSSGVDITADMYPYPASGTGLDAILPTWVQAGGTDSMLIRLADPAVRARLAEERAANDRSRPADAILINSVASDSLEMYEGVRLDEVGRMRGQDPYEAAYDILLADSGETSAIYFSMSEENVRLGLAQPWVSIGQDAGARTPDTTGRGRGHPRGFGTFPRILGRYVREDSVLTLEDAIRRMTSLPAQRVGLDQRGVLKEGQYADIVVFDPATVIDRATFEQPQQISTGMHHVFVNGTAVVDGGYATGSLPGRALLGPATQ